VQVFPASDLSSHAQTGDTPLIHASLLDSLEVARLLLEHKAAVNQADPVTMHKS
jgi:ankyrin repeat protein